MIGTEVLISLQDANSQDDSLSSLLSLQSFRRLRRVTGAEVIIREVLSLLKIHGGFLSLSSACWGV